MSINKVHYLTQTGAAGLHQEKIEVIKHVISFYYTKKRLFPAGLEILFLKINVY